MKDKKLRKLAVSLVAQTNPEAAATLAGGKLRLGIMMMPGKLRKLIANHVVKKNPEAALALTKGIYFYDWWEIEKKREKTQEEYESCFKLVRDGILLPEQAADRLHISLREFRERYDAVRGRE